MRTIYGKEYKIIDDLISRHITAYAITSENRAKTFYLGEDRRDAMGLAKRIGGPLLFIEISKDPEGYMQERWNTVKDGVLQDHWGYHLRVMKNRCEVEGLVGLLFARK